jgi:Fur family zinc uptake transcriptional regulator
VATFNTSAAAFGKQAHDHDRCRSGALNEAAALCRKRGQRLTDIRREVLALVWERHAPIGAYDILAALSATRGRVAPPTVYRALEFLLTQGLIHRIESLNAYVGCPVPTEEHSGQFLICTDCGGAAELSDPRIDAAISAALQNLGFEAERSVVEIKGRCPRCREKEAAA